MKKEDFIRMLREVLETTECKYLKKVWLVVPFKTKRTVLKPLEPGF